MSPSKGPLKNIFPGLIFGILRYSTPLSATGGILKVMSVFWYLS